VQTRILLDGSRESLSKFFITDVIRRSHAELSEVSRSDTLDIQLAREFH
jgi:hypothetical protein